MVLLMLKKPQVNHSHNKRSINIASLGVRARTIIVVSLSCVITIFFSLYWGEQSIDAFDNFIVVIYDKVNQPIEKAYNFIRLSKECVRYESKNGAVLLENQYLKQQVLNTAILEKENAELKRFANYLSNVQFHYITTNIVSASNNGFGLQVMLNVGTENGVSEGQAVVNPEGIIGRVIKVSQKSSKVLPWYNQNFKVPVVLLKSGIHCIASGANGYMELLYLPENVEPIEGEIAITSGEGGIIPFGIKVGEIAVTNFQEEEFILKPATGLNLFTIVAVAINTDPNSNK